MKDNVSIECVDDTLYSILCEWWKARQWTPMPREALCKRGYVAFIDDIPIVAGFLYKDETACLAMLGWVISNPNSTHEERDIALDELLKHIESVAHEIGATLLMTSLQHEPLIDRLKKHNFIVLSNKSVDMAKLIANKGDAI